MEEPTKIIPKEVLYMNLPIEPMLYIDIQAAKPLSFCPDCGAERYGAAGSCPRCERRRK